MINRTLAMVVCGLFWPYAFAGAGTPPTTLPQAKRPDEYRGHITGVVVSATNREPIVGAYVGIGDLEDAPNLATRLAEEGRFSHTETNEEGRFTLDNVALCDHPLLVTHPEFVRRDRVVELRPDAPQTELTISLKPAAKIRVTAVDAAGKPVQEKFTFRLEALDGHRFIPPGKNRHLSVYASPSWMEEDKSGSFLFTELDEGEYIVDVMKRTVEPAPHDRAITHVDYYGGISSVAVRPEEVREVSVPPQDHGTVVEVNLQGEALTTPAPPRLAALFISRNTGLLVWDLGLGQGPEFPCFGRVAENPLIRAFCGVPVSQEPLPPTASFPAGPIRIRNLPPGSYSLFVYVVPQMVLEGRRVELVRSQASPVTVKLVLWEEMAPDLRNLNRHVGLESRNYRLQELCDLLGTAAESAPQFLAVPSLRDATIRFEAGDMSIWEVMEKLHRDKGWVLGKEGDNTLVVAPPKKLSKPIENQPSQQGQVPPNAEKAKPDTEVFWPTDQALEKWIVVIGRTEGGRYGLTDEQLAQWDRTRVHRWKPYFFELRLTRLLIRQFVEAGLGPQPPDAELVKRWAKHARPVFDVIRDHILASQAELKAMVKPEQMDRFMDHHNEIVGFLEAYDELIGRWERGEVNEGEWWQSDPERRERDRQQSMELLRAFRMAGVAPPASRPAETTTMPSDMPR